MSPHDETLTVTATRTVRDRLFTPENAATGVAVVLAILGAWALQTQGESFAAGYLGLIALGVSVPNTLTRHGLLGGGPGAAVGRTVLACLLTFAAYVGLLAVLLDPGGVTDPLWRAGTAFLGTEVLAEALGRWVGRRAAATA